MVLKNVFDAFFYNPALGNVQWGSRNDNEYYDYDRKILRTSETKRSENIDNIVSKNESSKSFKVNKKGQYVLNEESAPWPKWIQVQRNCGSAGDSVAASCSELPFLLTPEIFLCYLSLLFANPWKYFFVIFL